SSTWSGRGVFGDDVATSPQTRPSTMIGAPATLLNPWSRAAAASEPRRSAYSSIRTARPVRSTSADIDGPSSGQREPGPKVSGCTPWTATTVIVEPSSSYRQTAAFIRRRTCATSCATAENTSADGAPDATSVATPRHAG